MFYPILQVIIPLYLFYYGAKLRYKTPPFGTERGAINSWRTRTDKDEWVYGNKFGGLVEMCYAAFLSAALGIKYLIRGSEDIASFNNAYAAVALVAILSPIPITHIYLTKKFGKRKYVSGDPPRRLNPYAVRRNSKKK